MAEIFLQKIDEIFRELPNSLSIADDILIVGYDANGMDDHRIWDK